MDEKNIFAKNDIDDAGKVIGYIKAGWAFLSILLAAGLFRFGANTLPQNPVLTDYGPFSALMAVSVLVLLWVFFPMDDLKVLRKWVHTYEVKFPSGSTEAYMIFFVAVLLSLLILSTRNPFWFGIAGICVFTYNILGFAYIRHIVKGLVGESRHVYNELPEDQRTIANEALDVVNWHWCCGPKHHFLLNIYQIRHCLLVLCFAVGTILTLIADGNKRIVFLAYMVYVTGLFLGEVWMLIWRHLRDRKLERIDQDLRKNKRSHDNVMGSEDTESI